MAASSGRGPASSSATAARKRSNASSKVVGASGRSVDMSVLQRTSYLRLALLQHFAEYLALRQPNPYEVTEPHVPRCQQHRPIRDASAHGVAPPQRQRWAERGELSLGRVDVCSRYAQVRADGSGCARQELIDAAPLVVDHARRRVALQSMLRITQKSPCFFQLPVEIGPNAFGHVLDLATQVLSRRDDHLGSGGG